MTTDAADADEQWVVVGGRGKPRKGTQQQQQQQQQQPGICTAAASTQAAAALPGWGDATQASSGGFTYGSSAASKGSRRRHPQQHAGSSMEQQVVEIARELRQSGVYAALTAAMQQVASTGGRVEQQQHQQQQQWEWSRVQQLVVYGLGCVEDSKVSRHQLAMVLLLRELLPGLLQPPQLYDPAFSATDARLLQQLGLHVIEGNEEGRRSTGGQQTLFFLPHCEGVLCDNLLATNWSPAALGQLAILGNSFDSYRQRWCGALKPPTTASRPDKLLQLVQHGVVREVAVPDGKYPVPSAFNDMSLHTFDSAAAAGLFDC